MARDIPAAPFPSSLPHCIFGIQSPLILLCDTLLARDHVRLHFYTCFSVLRQIVTDWEGREEGKIDVVRY